MKGRPVDELVYEQMFPKPRSQDPQNFHALLSRHLILEVRQEVHSFYGHLDTPEAKYPGLDYNNYIHRTRLSRWQWHRRLFRAFDALRLTPNEVSALTKWEGTKWAKERYEKEQGCVIRDTAMDGMPVWNGQVDQRTTARVRHDNVQESQDDVMAEVTDEESEGELESVGIALNERIQERLAARNAGDSSLPLDEAWEQWFKNAVESGEISAVRERMLETARAGNWDEIPAVLQNVIRDALLVEQRGSAAAPSSSGASSRFGSTPLTPSHVGRLFAPHPALPQATHAPTSRSWSGLRIPGDFQGVDGTSSSSNTSGSHRANA